MSEQKTKPTDQSVESFLAAVPDAQKREDSYVLLAMMREIMGESPRMWGPSMIGFGEYHYKYATGHQGDSFIIGFSPRKAAISLYFTCDIEGDFAEALKSLGKFKVGKGCLYVKRLAEIDLAVLREMVETAVAKLSTIPTVKVKKE